jgi:DNA modification methylase
MAGYKPVLWYVKEKRRGHNLIVDVLRDKGKDKSDHEWGQGVAGVPQLIEDLTEPGELIVDPFAGSCLWGNISASMGRRWLGADIAKGGTATAVTQFAEAAE